MTTATGGNPSQARATAHDPATESPPQSDGVPAPATQRSLVPKGGNDRIYTPDRLAMDIVRHFMPSGKILEPCAGDGAFLRALPLDADWYEIDLGRDFLEARGHPQVAWKDSIQDVIRAHSSTPNTITTKL